MSIARQNNNPLNIRPGLPWEGLGNPAQRGGFCNFSSPVWGFRAVFKNYISKYDRGTNTIRKLINEWAPPEDNNDTSSYIVRVCNATGYPPDEVIELKTWDVGSKICYAQAVVESGDSFEANWTIAQMAEGAFRAGIVDAPKPLASKIGSTISSYGAGATAAVASIQASVDAANTQPHSHTLAIGLTITAGVLALIGAILRAKAKVQG